MELLELARVLQKRRDAIGITKAEIARRIEVSESYVGLVEQGKRRASKAVLERWAKVLLWREEHIKQLLILAGHVEQEQTNALTQGLLLPSDADFFFPNVGDLEAEVMADRVKQLLVGTPPDRQQDAIRLLSSFLSWLQFEFRS